MRAARAALAGLLSIKRRRHHTLGSINRRNTDRLTQISPFLYDRIVIQGSRTRQWDVRFITIFYGLDLQFQVLSPGADRIPAHKHV
jgi:hypothetical protein